MMTRSLLLIGAVALAGCAPQNAPATAPAPVGPIAGTINGTPVPQGALDAFLAGQFRKPANELTPDERTRGQEAFAQMMALSQEAQRLNLDQDPEVAGQIMLQRSSILARSLINQKTSDGAVDETQVQSIYDERIASGELREYNARHILVETEDEAKAIIEQLNGGADFAELAKTESTGPSGPNGGDLGWFGEGRMVEPFFNATIALEAGAYSSEPVQTRFGWHVIKLEETRDQPFEQASEQIRGTLQREWVENYVNGLTETATINWNASAPSTPSE